MASCDSVDYAILTTGYHGEEVSIASSVNWVGLFETDSGYCLRNIELLVEPFNDTAYHLKNKYVGVTGEDDPVWLFWSAESVYPEGSLSALLQNPVTLLEDSSFILNSNWRLYCSADGLFLTDGVISQQLSELCTDRNNGNILVVHWLGDLDGDMGVDLILSEQREYDSVVYSLFLTSETDSGLLLNRVASFISCGIGW